MIKNILFWSILIFSFFYFLYSVSIPKYKASYEITYTNGQTEILNLNVREISDVYLNETGCLVNKSFKLCGVRKFTFLNSVKIEKQ